MNPDPLDAEFDTVTDHLRRGGGCGGDDHGLDFPRDRPEVRIARDAVDGRRRRIDGDDLEAGRPEPLEDGVARPAWRDAPATAMRRTVKKLRVAVSRSAGMVLSPLAFRFSVVRRRCTSRPGRMIVVLREAAPTVLLPG
jgi:hypothetical protein